ncbi:unnamed protein product [Arctogadus glacialis]
MTHVHFFLVDDSYVLIGRASEYKDTKTKVELPAAAAVRCFYSLNSCAKFKLLDGSVANHRWDRRAEQPILGRTGGLSSQSEVGKTKCCAANPTSNTRR